MDRHVKRRDIAEAQENFGLSANQRIVQKPQNPRTSPSPPERNQSSYVCVCKLLIDIACPVCVASGQVTTPVKEMGCPPDLQPQRLQMLSGDVRIHPAEGSPSRIHQYHRVTRPEAPGLDHFARLLSTSR